MIVYLQASFAGQFLWAAANTAVKISILHFYVTVFPNTLFRKVCYGTMALSVGYFIMVFFEAFLLCTPVEFNWDKTVEGACAPNTRLVYVVVAIINLLLDVLIVILPMQCYGS